MSTPQGKAVVRRHMGAAVPQAELGSAGQRCQLALAELLTWRVGVPQAQGVV